LVSLDDKRFDLLRNQTYWHRPVGPAPKWYDAKRATMIATLLNLYERSGAMSEFRYKMGRCFSRSTDITDQRPAIPGPSLGLHLLDIADDTGNVR
jgi:hypothetical protein